MYVIEHCYSERNKELEHKAFEYYVTDVLHLIETNIAIISGGSYLASSWRELNENIEKTQDNRTGEEIAADVIKKAGLKERR